MCFFFFFFVFPSAIIQPGVNLGTRNENNPEFLPPPDVCVWPHLTLSTDASDGVIKKKKKKRPGDMDRG